MNRYVKANLADGGYIGIEVVEDANTLETTSNSKLMTKEFENKIDGCVSILGKVIEGFSDLGVDEVKFDFGLTVDFTAGVSFWAITKYSSEANLNVSVKWKAKDSLDAGQ